jgi:hypothetical protein
MLELDAGQFRHVCAEEGVAERIGSIESERRAAVRTFWIRSATGLLLAAAALLSLLQAGWEAPAYILGSLFLCGGIVAATVPLSLVKEGLKQPVLDALARRCGLEYIAADFDPPVYGHARPLLWGGLSCESFTDLFHGADEEGRGSAVYEARLQRKSGKSNVVVFSGQMYAIERKPGTKGVTVIVPDRKFLNVFKPARDMERVRIEGDDAFERRFEVYSTAPMEARHLLFSVDLRRRLLALREEGQVLVYLSPQEALVAARSRKDRFEPGSMFRSRSGEERVKQMFNDLAGSLDTLREFKRRLG